MPEPSFSEIHAAAVARREALRQEARAAREAGNDALADDLSEQWSQQRHYCWALAQRRDARLMHAKGQSVLMGPNGDVEAWLSPTLSFMTVEFERLVVHYKEAVQADGFAAGPLKSAEVALEELRNHGLSVGSQLLGAEPNGEVVEKLQQEGTEPR